MHAAAIIDTLGLFFIVMGLIVAKGFVAEDGSFDITSIKLACVVFFLWLTSPVSSHVISKLIYMTDSNTDKETVEIDVNEFTPIDMLNGEYEFSTPDCYEEVYEVFNFDKEITIKLWI